MYRLRLLFAFFTLLLFLVWLRLFYWQVVQGERIRGIASSEHVGRFSLSAKRGEFFTSDGFPLVINSQMFRVVADPHLIDVSADTIADRYLISSLFLVFQVDQFTAGGPFF